MEAIYYCRHFAPVPRTTPDEIIIIATYNLRGTLPKHRFHSHEDGHLLPPMPSTVPTFNSCTKCMRSPGIIHDRTTIAAQFPGQGCTDDPRN